MSDALDSDDDTQEKSHHHADLEMVDPNILDIDNLNERTKNTGPRTDLGNLETSIAENGIENPPQVRPKKEGDGYKVFAGQRRVLAAQAIGINEIPVIVKDLDDLKALAASVNENNEHLKKKVSRKDRANAVQRLEEDWDRKKVANQFGVEPQTIRNWLEPTIGFWEGTIFDPNVESDLDTEYIANDLLADLRRTMVRDKLAERAAKVIIKKRIPTSIIRRAIKTTENPAEFLREMQEQWEAHSSGHDQVRPRITLTKDDANDLRTWAKSRGLSIEQAAKKLVKMKLDEISDSGNDAG